MQTRLLLILLGFAIKKLVGDAEQQARHYV